MRSLDVDRELWEVLDLCSDEELECIYDILHSASPFSPVVKSIVREDEPPLLQLRGRSSIMHKVRCADRTVAIDLCSVQPLYSLAVGSSLCQHDQPAAATAALTTHICLGNAVPVLHA
jgi:hypothetical protein